MKKVPIFLLLLVLPLSIKAEDRKSEYTAIEEFPVYETNFLDKPFVILGKVNAKASSLKELSTKIRRAAYKHGGDAVLGYKVQNTGSVSWWTGGQMSYAEGIVVKYDENGIKKITENTPIPILE